MVLRNTMMSRRCPILLLLWAGLVGGFGLSAPSQAHDQHESFSAGEPGDPRKPSRVVKVSMQEEGKKMLFDPALIPVRKGEQIRFVLFNEGTESHEFVLATVADSVTMTLD